MHVQANFFADICRVKFGFKIFREIIFIVCTYIFVKFFEKSPFLTKKFPLLACTAYVRAIRVV